MLNTLPLAKTGRDKVFVLVDCNNFFVSCERVFNPALIGAPVGVLSNNDGCFIARSNEVKALGIPMGAPHFQHTETIKKHQIRMYSANFKLYGDMSQRVANVLGEEAPRIEIYSVDESFLEIGDLDIDDYQKWAQHLSAKIEKYTGIPVSVGVAPSKTLAKLASERAKKFPDLKGGCSLVADKNHSSEEVEKRRKQYLEWLGLSDVWGIGRQYTKKLRAYGLSTAYDFTQLSDQWVLDNMTVLGLRTLRELRGESCIPLEEHDDQLQKTIASTRSFGHNIRSVSELEQAVATFAVKAAVRLRRKKELTWGVTTFIRTGRSAPEQRSIGFKSRLLEPTNDTSVIIRAALKNLYQAFDSDFSYKKAGVILTELVPEDAQQLSFANQKTNQQYSRQQNLLKAIDQLNRNHTQVVFGSQGVAGKKRWHSRSERKSQLFTSSWYELPTVKVT